MKKLQDDFNAIACEMEGASIALVCKQYGVPFVVIRVMSDKADGAAHETYENMADIAADHSSRIVMEMLDEPALLSDYWTEGSQAASKLNDYLLAVTDEASPDYIPVQDRVAVFDLDGTLMCETYPFCFEYMVFADYALKHADALPEDVVAVAREIEDAAGAAKPDGMSTRQAAAAAIAYKGMTPGELARVVADFKGRDAWGFKGLKRSEAWYKPMVELFEKLQANDFTVYVVTATERNIVREVVRGTLDIPPSHVIGTEYGYTATNQADAADADYTFSRRMPWCSTAITTARTPRPARWTPSCERSASSRCWRSAIPPATWRCRSIPSATTPIAAPLSWSWRTTRRGSTATPKAPRRSGPGMKRRALTSSPCGTTL